MNGYCFGDFVEIPKEVWDRVMWCYGARPGFPSLGGITDVDPSRVSFFAKDQKSRACGWAATTKKVGDINNRNPWRKCHTENYWCWYLVGVNGELADH